MAEDLRPYGVAANIVLPGGATATGMIPDALPDAARRNLRAPKIMGPPAVFLSSAEADGVTGERIIVRDFDRWLPAFRARSAPPG